MSIFTGSGVAIVTPFHADESVNYDKLDEMLNYHCNHGTDSIMEQQENLQLYQKKSIWMSSGSR